MSVTLLEIMAAARGRRASLAAEVAGYLVLALTDQVAGAPRRVEPREIALGEDGTLRLLRGVACPARDAESELRATLTRMLLIATSATPALLRVAQASESAGLDALQAELETALIPLNRTAARRALARLYRETVRAIASGQLEAIEAPVLPVPVAVADPLPPPTLKAAPTPSEPPLPETERVELTPPALPEAEPVELAPPTVLPDVVPCTPMEAVVVDPETVPEPVVIRARVRRAAFRRFTPRTPLLGTLAPEGSLPSSELTASPTVPMDVEAIVGPEPELEVEEEWIEVDDFDDSDDSDDEPWADFDGDSADSDPTASPVVAEAESDPIPGASYHPWSSPEPPPQAKKPVESERTDGAEKDEPADPDRLLGSALAIWTDDDVERGWSADPGEVAPGSAEDAAPTAAASRPQEDLQAPLSSSTEEPPGEDFADVEAVILPPVTETPELAELSGTEASPPFSVQGVAREPEFEPDASELEAPGPRTRQSDVSELVAGFTVAQSMSDRELCRDLKRIAGLEPTPSETPPPAIVAGDESAPVRQPSPQRRALLVGAAVALLVAVPAAGLRARIAARRAVPLVPPRCSATLELTSLPPASQVVVRQPETGETIAALAATGPALSFHRLPCRRPLSVTVKAESGGSPRWVHIPVSAAELAPSPDEPGHVLVTLDAR